MYGRVLNVYFLRDENTLSLRFVELQRIDEEQEARDAELQSHWRRLQDLRRPRFLRVCPDIHDQINYEYIGYTSSAIYKNNTESKSIVTYEADRYEYNEMIMPLQKSNADGDGVELLLKQLGPLDAVLHHYQKYNQEIGCKINFPDHPADFSDKQRMMSATFSARQGFPPLKESMTRTLANWIIAEVERTPEELAAYADALPELKRLLALEDASLTYAIRKQYYPQPALESRVANALKLNPLKAAMFNPDTSCRDKDKLMLLWLRNQLNPKLPATSYFGMFKQLITGTEPKQADVGNNIKTINNMFAELKAIRIHLWRQKLEGLVGQIASDGGPYTGRTDGILNMLFDAKFYLNNDGAMVVDYSGPAFRNDLAYDFESDSDELLKLDAFEAEIRHAFKLLGLELLPEQDFYDNKVVVFTKKSTRTLMDWGYHLTEDHCKKLLTATHDFRKFGMVFNQVPELDSFSGEVLLNVVKEVAPSLPENEIFTVNELRLGR